MALTAGMTVDQLANADLCYAPPFAPAMDNIITAANVVRNKIDGHMDGVAPAEVYKMLEEKEDFLFLDVRSPQEYEQVRLPGSTLIPLGSLRGRLDELPKNKEVIAFCKISLRGYEAAPDSQSGGFHEGPRYGRGSGYVAVSENRLEKELCCNDTIQKQYKLHGWKSGRYDDEWRKRS